MYDDTLIVVTADHGFAWQVGVPTRRSVSRSNVNELGPVPLFVKAPGQTHGARERCARPDPRRDSHDRGRTERAARLPRGRQLGVLARGSSPASGEPHHARLQLDRAHVGPALEGTAPRRGPAPAPPPRLGRLGEPLHEPRATSRAHRSGRGERAQARRRARDDLAVALFRARAALQRRRAVPDRRPDTRLWSRRASATWRSP